MRLKQVTISGLRCFRSAVSVELDSFCAVLGRNDAGKSTVLEALDLFFNETLPDAGDFSAGIEPRTIHITCVFEDLPAQLVIDADHPTTLQDEFLTDDAGCLRVTKEYDGSLVKPKARTLVQALHPSAEGYSDLLKLKNKELKDRAAKLGVDLANAPKSVNTALRRAIWESCGDLKLAETVLSIDDETTKNIWAELKRYVPMFALFKADRPSTDQDAEAQDPIKIAVTQALREQEAQLEVLRQAVEAAVLEVARLTLRKLAEIDPTLAQEIKPTVTKPNWANAFKIGLTDDLEVPINKRGSGVRRLVLLNFFRAQAELRHTSAEHGGIIYAIEEPETSQHPTNQKLLLRAFSDLALQPGHQVIVTTHNPVLARGLPVSCLRLIQVCDDRSRMVLSNDNKVYETACSELGVLPDNDVLAFIGVEGPTDIDFFRGVSRALSRDDRRIVDLQAEEDAGRIVFIPLGGANLASWIGRLRNLRRPEFHFYDRDTAPTETPKYQAEIERVCAIDGCFATSSHCREIENYIHPRLIQERWPEIAWATHAPETDVPRTLAARLVAANGQDWDALNEQKRRRAESGVKRVITQQLSSLMTRELLAETDPTDSLRSFLWRVSDVVIATSASPSGPGREAPQA